MKRWLDDRHFRSLLKNSSYLTVAKAIAAIAGLASLALAGRGLGLEQFGLLILITSYAQAASGLSRFQSWQLIIRYGGGPLHRGDDAPMRRATGFALALDIWSGIIGTIAAIALLPLIGHWFGIGETHLDAAAFYCLTIPFIASATPIGILRVLDRFDLLSIQSSIYPILRAVLVAYAWWAELDFMAYLWIWFGTEMFGQLLPYWWAWRELRSRGIQGGMRPTLRPRDLPGAWRFAINVNLTISMKAAWGPVARLIVGGLLGPASAALYRVACSIADSAQKPADLFAKAFYPEVMKMDIGTPQPWHFLMRGVTIASAFGVIAFIILAAAGEPLIRLTFGDEFTAAFPPLLVMAGVPLLVLISFPLPPMLYALDKAHGPLIARAVGVIIFLASVAPLARRYDLIGAAMAYLAGNIAMVALMLWQTIIEYRRIRRAQTIANTWS